MVTIRNSLLVAIGNQDEVECTELNALNNAAEMPLGGANVTLRAIAPGQPEWFVGFNSGDLRLNSPPLPVYSAARWQADDPTTDIEGHPRVALEGAMDVAGADVPAPLGSEEE